MTTLAFDTATETLSVALRRDGQVFVTDIDAGLSHSERLLAAADGLLALARLEPRLVDLVACMRGPGSFTGLRIGMAVVKGMTVSLGIPFVAIPTLHCLAAAHAAWPGRVLPVIDARKSRWFGAVFRSGIRLGDDFDADADEIARRLSGDDLVLVCGPDAPNAAAALSDRLGPGRIVADTDYRRGAARELAAAAESKFMDQGRGDDENSGLSYLRQSDAELNLKGGAER